MTLEKCEQNEDLFKVAFKTLKLVKSLKSDW